MWIQNAIQLRNTGEQGSSRTPFILDPDFSSDDSTDEDYELVARPRKVTTAADTEGSSKTVEEIDPELDISLASFLMDLKKGKEKVTVQGMHSHDREMEQEFAIEKQHATYGSTTEIRPFTIFFF